MANYDVSIEPAGTSLRSELRSRLKVLRKFDPRRVLGICQATLYYHANAYAEVVIDDMNANEREAVWLALRQRAKHLGQLPVKFTRSAVETKSREILRGRLIVPAVFEQFSLCPVDKNYQLIDDGLPLSRFESFHVNLRAVGGGTVNQEQAVGAAALTMAGEIADLVQPLRSVHDLSIIGLNQVIADKLDETS